MKQFQGTLRPSVEGDHPLEALCSVGDQMIRVSGDSEEEVKEALERAVALANRVQQEKTWTFEV